MSQLSDEHRAQSTWALANSYSVAAKVLHANGTPVTFIPTVYLLAHALELHLKSFLNCCGVKDKGLRGLGHDLVAALAECERHGLNSYVTISNEDLELVKRVNLCYEKKELEYFVGKAKSLGSIDDFTYLVSRVSKALFNPLDGSQLPLVR